MQRNSNDNAVAGFEHVPQQHVGHQQMASMDFAGLGLACVPDDRTQRVTMSGENATKSTASEFSREKQLLADPTTLFSHLAARRKRHG